MSMVRRVYVEKKPGFAVQAEELKHEIQSYLGLGRRDRRAGADPLRCGESVGRYF